jgi:hypothetical protein
VQPLWRERNVCMNRTGSAVKVFPEINRVQTAFRMKRLGDLLFVTSTFVSSAHKSDTLAPLNCVRLRLAISAPSLETCRHLQSHAPTLIRGSWCGFSATPIRRKSIRRRRWTRWSSMSANRRLLTRSEQRRKCLTSFNRGGPEQRAQKNAVLATFSATVACAALRNRCLSY